MTKKILWLGFSLMLTATIAFAGGGADTAATTTAVAVEVVPGGGDIAAQYGGITVPQYGGTFTPFIGKAATDAANPDAMAANPDSFGWLSIMQERPIYGDNETYGGFGTGEWAFQTNAFQHPDFQKGALIESWEIENDKITWQVRQGVMWAPSDDQIARGVMAAPRELVAEDLATDIEYFRSSPMGNRFDGALGDVYATGKYELVLEMPTFSADKLMYFLGYEDRSTIESPETRAFDPSKYENHVGTGPFIIKEYVIGSHMAFTRNPLYWDEVTIGGTDYQMPFIDEMVTPIIPDPSTRIAALRTGSIDFHDSPGSQDWAGLDQTNPELLNASYADGVTTVGLRSDEPPFDDRNVRRAMMIGTDIEATRRMLRSGDLPLHAYPIYYGNPAVYTPIDELPAEARELYDYNPAKARQMLADAGYPDGFEIDFLVSTRGLGSGIEWTDIASLLQEQWGEIGVKVNIDAQEWLTFRENQYSRNYHGVVQLGMELANPVLSLVNGISSTGFLNHSLYQTPVTEDYISRIQNERDRDRQNTLIKEVGPIILSDVPEVPLGSSPNGHYWWPWIRNHFGERSTSDGQLQEVFRYLWIDQSLKEEMGFDPVGTANRPNP